MEIAVDIAADGGFVESASTGVVPVDQQSPGDDTVRVPLIRLCYGRSGDKGNNANVGLIARRPEYLPVLRDQVTVERVRRHFAHNCQGEVERFDLPGLNGMFITGFAAVALHNRRNTHPDAKVLSKPFHLRDLVDEIERTLAA